MNYKDKKYLLEDKWLVQKLDKFNFFLIAQLKSCNGDEWVKFQKELKKLNLKVKLISFKNVKDTTFFSKLSPNFIENLLKGNVVLIYSIKEKICLINTITSLKTMSLIRLLVISISGRLLDVNCSNTLKTINDITSLEWNEIFNKLNGSNLCSTLNILKCLPINLLYSQHIMLYSILLKKTNNEKNL
jgi:hypothetical protein